MHCVCQSVCFSPDSVIVVRIVSLHSKIFHLNIVKLIDSGICTSLFQKKEQSLHLKRFHLDNWLIRVFSHPFLEKNALLCLFNKRNIVDIKVLSFGSFTLSSSLLKKFNVTRATTWQKKGVYRWTEIRTLRIRTEQLNCRIPLQARGTYTRWHHLTRSVFISTTNLNSPIRNVIMKLN